MKSPLSCGESSTWERIAPRIFEFLCHSSKRVVEFLASRRRRGFKFASWGRYMRYPSSRKRISRLAIPEAALVFLHPFGR